MKQKFGYLEGIRGLAALIVVFHHFALAFYPAVYFLDKNMSNTKSGLEMHVGNSPLNLFISGNFSVCIFFVLSGYVLTFKLFKDNDLSSIISNAYRRYFRLIVPVFFVSFISLLCTHFLLYSNIEVANMNHNQSWLAVIFNGQDNFWHFLKATFIDVFFGSNSEYDSVLWTMSTEFKGSFLVFAIAALFGRTNKRYIVYLLFIGLTWDNYYLAFILGMMIADLFHSENSLKERLNNKFFNAALLVVGVYLGTFPTVYKESVFYKWLFESFGNYPFQFHIVGAFLVILSICNLASAQKFISHPVFLYLGKISFSLYLLHPIILGTISCYIFLKIIPHMSYSAAVLIVCAISFVAVFIASHFMTKYIDEPNVKLTQWIYKKYFKDSVKATEIHDNKKKRAAV